MQQVAPTRMNLTTFKGKKEAATKGHSLLKQKADALKMRFRDLCKQIYSTKNGMGAISSDSYFSLTEAEYAAGNIRSKVFEGVGTAQVRVTSRTDNVAGVKLPVFTRIDVVAKETDNIGLAQGGRKVGVCKNKFLEYTEKLIKLASLQTSFVAMDEALKITNRRVNALENVTIPAILETIASINRELDELEREDFTRLKVVKRKKEEAKKIAETAYKTAAAKSVKTAVTGVIEEKSTESSAAGGSSKSKTSKAAAVAPAVNPVVEQHSEAPKSSSVVSGGDKPSTVFNAPEVTTAQPHENTEKKKKQTPKKKAADADDNVFS